MGAWQPVNVIPDVGTDGVPRIDWSGPAGAPLDFDVLLPDGDQDGTWLGQVRTTPDADIVTATFETPTFSAPDADSNVTGSFTLITTDLLVADQCYVYEVSQDSGDGYVPLVGGTLRPGISTARP